MSQLPSSQFGFSQLSLFSGGGALASSSSQRPAAAPSFLRRPGGSQNSQSLASAASSLSQTRTADKCQNCGSGQFRLNDWGGKVCVVCLTLLAGFQSQQQDTEMNLGMSMRRAANEKRSDRTGRAHVAGLTRNDDEDGDNDDEDDGVDHGYRRGDAGTSGLSDDEDDNAAADDDEHGGGGGGESGTQRSSRMVRRSRKQKTTFATPSEQLTLECKTLFRIVSKAQLPRLGHKLARDYPDWFTKASYVAWFQVVSKLESLFVDHILKAQIEQKRFMSLFSGMSLQHSVYLVYLSLWLTGKPVPLVVLLQWAELGVFPYHQALSFVDLPTILVRSDGVTGLIAATSFLRSCLFRDLFRGSSPLRSICYPAPLRRIAIF
eukprot:ANDGO_03550.mRNA.1 hypothetical protein